MIFKNFLPLILLLSLLGFSSTLFADDKSDIKSMMKHSIHGITTLIQDDTLSQTSKHQQIEAIITPIFDFSLMGRLSLGKRQWKKITPSERKYFIELFTQRIRQSYMSKLDLYTDEVVVIDEPVVVKKRIHLPTHLMRKNEQRDVLYKFYKSKKRGWLIYDVDILGVSIVQTYRTQFASILKDKDFDTLIEKLKISV